MKYKNWLIPFLIIVGIVPLLELLNPGLPITHDGQDHVARVANFYQNLSEGVIVPRWAGNLNWGYGHPILMFLYPLPSYMASLFHLFGFSFVDSVKLVFGLSFIASGLTMYVWLKEQFNETAGFIGALLYIFAPYRFVDLYVRGAIGEHVAFIFPPLVLYFLLKLSKKQSHRYFVGGSLSLAGLILSHNAISLMFLPLIFLYSIFLLIQAKEKKLLVISYWLLVILGFGLSTFFWLPAFMEGKYTLRDIVTSEDYSSRFVHIKDFVFGEWSYGGTDWLSKQVGLVHWLYVAAGFFAVNKYRKSRPVLYLGIGLIGVFFLTLLLMTNTTNFVWNTISLLQKFQFPWRFLSVTVFVSAVLGAYVVSTISKKRVLIIVAMTVVALLFFNKDYWQAKAFMQKPESFYSGIYNSTTDTGESSPVWSVRFMEKRPNARMELIDGATRIEEIERTNTRHVYRLFVEKKSWIRENTLYFPGWRVFVDGQEVLPEFQNPQHRGLMTFFIEKGEHIVTIQFTETKLRNTANAASLISLSLLLVLGILMKNKLWLRFR